MILMRSNFVSSWLPPITTNINHMTKNENVTRIWIQLEVVGSVVLCCSRSGVRKKRRFRTRSPPCAQIVCCIYRHTCNSHMLDRWAQCRALGWQIVSASALDFYSLCYQWVVFHGTSRWRRAEDMGNTNGQRQCDRFYQLRTPLLRRKSYLYLLDP